MNDYVFFFIRIRNAVGEVMFTARVIHSLPLMTSVVHVFYHDLLSVVCHLLGPDTLPTPAQVCDKRFIESYSKSLHRFPNYAFFVHENHES